MAMVSSTTPYRIALAACGMLILVVLAFGTPQSDATDTPFHPRPSRVSAGNDQGHAVLIPDRLDAGAIGSYELRITIGAQGVSTRGGILIGFPKAWFVNPFPIPKRLQTNDSGKPHFLTVGASRREATFDVSVDTTGFTGKIERFNQTIAAIDTGAPLRPGDVVSVRMANTTAPYIAGDDEVRVAIDAAGNGQFKVLDSGAAYTVKPGSVEDFTLIAPTEAVVGRSIQLQVTAFDRFWNVAEGFVGTIRLTHLDRSQTVHLAASNHGSTTLNWTPPKEGFYFPEGMAYASAGSEHVSIKGNPIRVFVKEPESRTYWGDLHSHSSISADGIGTDPFPYARNAVRLDFFAATEHADDDGNPRGNAIRPEDWDWIKERVRRFNEPGRFVTLLAYECSFPTPYGHHNVFFRSMDGVPWPAAMMRSVENLWAKLRSGEAITVPHHTGIAFGGAPAGAESAGPGLQPVITSIRSPVTSAGQSVNWSIHDSAKRPLLEIYSLHGSSERYDPEDPLSYENAHFTFSRSVPGAHYARDAWAAGLELGVIAASDNHGAQPGQPQGGLTAVRASSLTREAIFDGLADKSTYGTTGQRIYMDVVIGGVRMGHGGRRRGPVKANVTIAAPSDIERAELIRRDLPSGNYMVVAHWDAAGRLLQTTFSEAPTSRRVMYYVRVQLKEPVRGRVVRGWSSPVWLDLDAP